MRRNILMILFVLLLSGCSANYNLTIDKNVFKEELFVDGVSINDKKSLVLPIEYDVDEYDVDEVKNGDEGFYKYKIGNNNFSLSYSFNNDNFSYSKLLNSCYKKVFAGYIDNYYMITTTGSFSCFDNYSELDNVKVVIKSQYKLVNSNADSIEGFNYIWNIDRNNLDNGIFLQLDTSSRKKSIFELLGGNSIYIFIFQFILILILFVFFLFIRNVNKDD